MTFSQAEMDLMRYGYDGGGTYHGVEEVAEAVELCDQCGKTENDCECCGDNA